MDLVPAGDVPDLKITIKRLDSSEIQPRDHCTVLDTLPSDDNTASVASPSGLSVESAALTTSNDPDERSIPQKRVHPETDSDDPYSNSERPNPQRRRYFGTKYFSPRTNRCARNEMSPSLNNPMQDRQQSWCLQRTLPRTYKEPGHLKDFLPYK